MTDAINFTISKNGTTAGFSQFLAESPEGNLIATICPRYMSSGKYSGRFMNVCFMDGTVEIADREDGEFETEHASELIAKKISH